MAVLIGTCALFLATSWFAVCSYTKLPSQQMSLMTAKYHVPSSTAEV